MKRHNKEATPLLVGELQSNGVSITVWCPHCKVFHYHGWDKNAASNDVSHRFEHCVEGSPFIGTGYFIGITPPNRKKR